MAGETIDGALEQLSQAFGAFGGRKTSLGEGFDWSADFNSAGILTHVGCHFGGEWETWPVTDTPEMLTIVRPHIGSLNACVGRKVVEGTPGSLLVASNLEAERFFFRGEQAVTDVIYIDWNIIAATVASVFDRPLNDALSMAAKVDLSTPTGQWILRLVDAVADGMRSNGPLANAPLALFHTTEALANLLILNVPHRFTHLLDRRTALIAPRHVKKAIDFMHENIASPITIQAVAQAVGVSLRSLEVGFRSFRNTTPTAYLQAIRLAAVHADLSNAQLALSIKEVCLKWGFFHFGRFAETYRKAYGETPSDTRRRAMLGRG